MFSICFDQVYKTEFSGETTVSTEIDADRYSLINNKEYVFYKDKKVVASANADHVLFIKDVWDDRSLKIPQKKVRGK